MPIQNRLRLRGSSLIRDRGIVAILAAVASQALPAAQVEVPYVPTPQVVVDRMLEMAGVGPRDYLIDLGSGDGRIVITAAKKYGVRGFGVDIDPERIQESNENAQREGVADRVAFYQRDLFDTSLADATVITMYLLPQINLALRPRLLALKPGTRIVSHDFSMDAWKPDQHVVVRLSGDTGRSTDESDIYFWRVPAHVAGRWAWSSELSGRRQDYEIVLQQTFQVLAGTARVDGRTVALDRARVNGSDLSVEFTIVVNGSRVKHVLEGKVDGDDVSGSASLSGDRIQSRRDWTAKRAARAAMTMDEAGRRRYAPHPPSPH